MNRMLVQVLAAIVAMPLLAQERQTIYVAQMEGLEPFVKKSLQAAELPFDFVDEEKRPDLKTNLSRLHSAYGENLYRHNLGRNETHRLELLHVARNKVVAWHMFQLKGDDESRQRAAREFAEKVKKIIHKNRADRQD